MTLFIDVDQAAALYKRLGVARAIREMAGYIQADYLRWQAFEKSPRTANHSPTGVIELMPADDGQQYAFKYVNGHPGNPARQLLTVMAFGVLAEVDSGYPLLLSELTLTTAVRTAATSALVARALARPDSRTMALIGNGAQSEFHAIAFHDMLGIDELRIFDIDPAASRKLKHNLQAWPGLKVRIAESVADAVKGADIVTTVTADKAYATILTPELIEPGMHLNAVGGDCPGKTELHPDILLRSDIFVEYPPQTRIEGEIQQLPPDHPVTELWQVIAGRAEGRRGADQITLFDSVGFAIEDFSALRYVRARIEGTGFFEELDLLADPDEPRDLFGMLLRAQG